MRKEYLLSKMKKNLQVFLLVITCFYISSCAKKVTFALLTARSFHVDTARAKKQFDHCSKDLADSSLCSGCLVRPQGQEREPKFFFVEEGWKFDEREIHRPMLSQVLICELARLAAASRLCLCVTFRFCVAPACVSIAVSRLCLCVTFRSSLHCSHHAIRGTLVFWQRSAAHVIFDSGQPLM